MVHEKRSSGTVLLGMSQLLKRIAVFLQIATDSQMQITTVVIEGRPPLKIVAKAKKTVLRQPLYLLGCVRKSQERIRSSAFAVTNSMDSTSTRESSAGK
jgi:hypothetical protein